ncbi:MAG TPA: ATP-binding protein [Thermoanaerobaculia bacterium]|nr:ATP-binding protein [Thermoanaerobaculia bacterium]
MSWYAANDRHVEQSLARVRRLLESRAAGTTPAEPAVASFEIEGYPPALESLASLFGLSAFERDVVTMAAGPELDAGFGALCAAAQGDPQRPWPSFGLALAALPEPHWSAASPQGPLRHWRLLEVGREGGLMTSPLRLDERVLHYLRGLDVTDERLAGIAEPLPPARALVPSHRALAERLARAWARTAGGAPPPVAELTGAEPEGKREVFAAAAVALGLSGMIVAAGALPVSPGELDGLVRLLGREAAFGHAALFVDAQELEPADALRDAALSRLAESFRGPLALAVRDRRRPRRRTVLPLEVEKPTPAEQAGLWRAFLGPAAAELNGHLEGLTAQFDLSAAAIRSAAAEALSTTDEGEEPAPAALGAVLWQASLGQARPRLEALAQRIRPAAGWDTLVLPERERQVLSEIAVHVRRRSRVYGDWGFAARGSRGLGVSALFAGPSGTGKTMAAEVLAGELGLDLFRIDLSAVVSKYIGETEKNLRQVFDAAEGGGAILLFDEADALFGKRSEVKDSHDRYANIEVGYLLQRMEAYRGLAILTSNLKNSLDPAFLRRLRFVVQFPFPDAALREEIWRRVFPPETPLAGLDYPLLARLGVAGGNIRNIALSAAFLAADADGGGEPVRMAHVLRAAQSEYAKIEKPLTAAETKGWEA